MNNTIDTNGDTILVLGRGPSTVEVVRESESDWSLIQYAPPRLRALIEEEHAKGGDVWLVAIESGHAEELDRDRAVIGYAPAWRPVA